jgi:phosphoglycolate phosphatase
VTVLVLLDIDGTLLTAFGEGRAAYYQTLDEMFPGREWPMIEMAGRTDFGIWCELTGLGEGDDWEAFKELYGRVMEERLAMRPPERLPGVEALCRALHEDPRFQIGIVTGNYEEGTRIKLRHGGLDRWFSDVPAAYGDRVHTKDDQAREVVLRERAGCEGALRAVVVGDTIADLRCARNASVACLAVLTGGGTEQELSKADLVLRDLSDTAAVLDSLHRIAM